MSTPLQTRKAKRQLVNGRLIATHIDPSLHGNANTYDYHYCRCEPCGDAKRRRRAGGGRSAEEVRNATQADLSWLIYEYEHLIGYGRGHDWVCGVLGIDPATVRRRLERNNYTHLLPRH